MQPLRSSLVKLLTGLITSVLVFSLSFQPALAAKDEAISADGPVGYDTGNPALTELWVDPVHGDDGHSGTSLSPLRTLVEAWARIPQGTLDTGRRINLMPGNYPVSSIPNYWELRHGTFTAPIFIQGTGSGPGQVILQGNVNMKDVSYIYFDNLSIIHNGDAFHCELCDHLLLRRVVLNGGTGPDQAQEALKVNQSQYVYVENSDISYAWDNAIDFVAVQYGHVINSHIHNAGDWCEYAKGGSAYIRVEANEIYNCGTGGFTAGQGTGFQFMSAPWLQYEAYDIKVINNVIHDTDGAGLGVNGGYNILMAYNTLYRVGRRDHVIEVVFGLRSCDGDPADPEPVRANCQIYLDAGGWGTTALDDGTNEINIPNKNVYIYNNVVYNPVGYQSQWQHFAIYEPRPNPTESHAPNPALTDDNLQIRGNVIWNGGASMPLGIEDTPDACSVVSNPTCNHDQLIAENAINTIQPQFANPSGGEFHPTGNWAASVTTYPIPDFGWDLSGVPAGENSNAVPVDFEGTSRTVVNPPGAYFKVVTIVTAPTCRSSLTQDGWVLESSENSNKGGSLNSSAATFNLGDDAANKQYRAILHFDTSALPETAVITAVTLKIKKQGQVGTNPFATHGALRADIRQAFFGTSAALQATDFQAAPNGLAATFGATPVSNWYSATLSSAGRGFINRTGPTQFRVYFTLGDNNDHGADYVRFYSGNTSAANRPQLIVQYYIP